MTKFCIEIPSMEFVGYPKIGKISCDQWCQWKRILRRYQDKLWNVLWTKRGKIWDLRLLQLKILKIMHISQDEVVATVEHRIAKWTFLPKGGTYILNSILCFKSNFS